MPCRPLESTVNPVGVLSTVSVTSWASGFRTRPRPRGEAAIERAVGHCAATAATAATCPAEGRIRCPGFTALGRARTGSDVTATPAVSVPASTGDDDRRGGRDAEADHAGSRRTAARTPPGAVPPQRDEVAGRRVDVVGALVGGHPEVAAGPAGQVRGRRDVVHESHGDPVRVGGIRDRAHRAGETGRVVQRPPPRPGCADERAPAPLHGRVGDQRSDPGIDQHPVAVGPVDRPRRRRGA